MNIVRSAGLPDDQPQVHVLVIGVGDYRHLPKGSAFASAPAQKTYNLEALDSPCKSATAFARWFDGLNLDNPKAPFGTLAVLLTTGTYVTAAGETVSVDVPTMESIGATADAWRRRCDRHERNIAIFYFCGHGFDGGDYTMLLPADFGNPAVRNLWANVIDFTTSYNAITAECKATTQLFLLDACRNEPPPLASRNGNPTAIWSTEKLQFTRRDAPILRSTTLGSGAHAGRGEISFFTAALLAALDRFGANHQNGTRWEVTTNSLASAMQVYLARLPGPDSEASACDNSGGRSCRDTVLHRLRGTARVMASIECDPADAIASADLSIACAEIAEGAALAWLPLPRPPAEKPCEVDVDAGEHYVRADFPEGASYATAQVKQRMFPPHTPCTLDVQR